MAVDHIEDYLEQPDEDEQLELRYPRNIEEAMADIAIVFHWSPEVMDAWGLDELMAWHDRARTRYEADIKARGLNVK